MSKLAFLVFLLVCIIPIAHTESATSSTSTSLMNNQGAGTVADNGKLDKMVSPKKGESLVVGWLSSFEFWMSFSVLSFGMLIFVIEIIMVRLTAFQPEQIIRILAVTLIVISTLFIITAGFDSEQIAPAMGLFGTIAGYMLGRADGKSKEEQG